VRLVLFLTQTWWWGALDGPTEADILTENNSLLETYILKYEQGLNHRWMTIADSTLLIEVVRLVVIYRVLTMILNTFQYFK